jgi:hypothetical protein
MRYPALRAGLLSQSCPILADERPSELRNLLNALKRARANGTGLVAVVWFCPSASTAAKVGRHPSICHPDRSEPGFPVELGGVGKLHAAFLTESRTRGRWRAQRNRKSGFAPVGMTNLRVAAHLGSGGGGGTEPNNEVPTPTKKLFGQVRL